LPLEAGVALGEDVAGGEELAVALLALEGDCDALEEAPLGVLDVPLEDEEPDWLDPVVVPLNGSTYCWSPAEVLVPEASAVPVGSDAAAASATQQARMRNSRRAMGVFKQ
jgi:hypothetical protein